MPLYFFSFLLFYLTGHSQALISQPTLPSPPHSANPRLCPVLRSDPRHLFILFAVIEFVCLFVLFFVFFFFFINVFSYGFGGCGGGG